MLTGRYRALAAPAEQAGSGRPGRGHGAKRQIPAYYKAGVVGCGLILLIVAVVGVAFVNVQTTTGSADRIANRYQPALDRLLGTQYDLHEAQIMLGNYLALPTSVGRTAYVARYREHLDRAEQRFAEFQAFVPELPDPGGLQSDYLAQLRGWAELVDASVEHDGELDPMQFGELMIQYANLRAALHRIIDQGLGSAMTAAGAQLIGETRAARRMLGVTLVVALLLGGAVTWGGVRAIRGQHTQILEEKAEREREAQRREFEHRLHRAFELVQTEHSALGIVRDALAETLQPEQHGELLISDSSVAHLERVVATSPEPARTGCNVTDPHECPAIRRNAQMVFANNRVFETCPYLRNRTEEPCSALCMPISIMGRTTGVLHIVGPADDVPADNQWRALATLASATGDELGLIRAFATKHQQANTDTLTGLENRRSLEARIPGIVARGDFSVAFIDIDRFKPLNDSHGHETGDRALRLFADVLRSALRPDDIAARWGGEEFVVVLPGIGAENAVPVVERIRDRLRNALSSGAVPGFTVSCGLSDSNRAQSFQEAVAQADDALLSAKRSGRNRVELAAHKSTADATPHATEKTQSRQRHAAAGVC
jgi:diguanylate cyclase (GGDEF)-like protein